MWRAFLSGQLPIVSNDWWLVTLTAHSRMRSQDQSYKNLQHGIDVIMKRIRRVFGKIDYVRVFEKHPKSDALHAHLIVSNLTSWVVPGCYKNMQPGFIAVTVRKGHTGTWSIRTWLKKTAQGCHVGYQADVERVTNQGAIWYVCKYLSKASQQITIKGLRHVSTSRRVGSPNPETTNQWIVGNYITGMDVWTDERVRDIQTGLSFPADSLREMGIYPPETERENGR